jgi:signal transduction histidine kinase
MRPIRLLLWPAGAALGVAAEWTLYGWSRPSDSLPDLAAGWSLIACGLVAWSRRPDSRASVLMTTTGLLWFAGNFVNADVGWLAWVSEHLQYVYRGPLVHLVLTYPRGRPTGRLDRGAIAACYAAAFLTPVWQSKTATIVLAGFLVAVSSHSWLRARGRERGSHVAALQATTFIAALLAVGAAVRTPNLQGAILLADQAALCTLAIALLAGLIGVLPDAAGVMDLVVELGETRSGTLRDALARALGDPTLQIGYWSPQVGAYVDDAGDRVELPFGDADRFVTRVDRGGTAVAALVHDRAVLDDPGLLDAVASASRLAASNARLQAEVRAQLAELQASRRRLLRSGDAERRRLEQRLREGAERRLLGLERTLDEAHSGTRVSDQTRLRIDRAEEQLTRTLAELRELARGLHPRVLSERGLAGALASLAEQSPVPVELSLSRDGLPEEIEAAFYFVCSEALANVAKYASASTATVTLSASTGVARIEIADDGVGGADSDRGTGLRGLADRVEALGGTLDVESRPGRGTRIVAELSLAGPSL